MGCRLMLDSGLSGGFRVGREGTGSTFGLLVVHSRKSCGDSGAPAQLDMICEGGIFMLLGSLLVTGSLTRSVSGDCSASRAV